MTSASRADEWALTTARVPDRNPDITCSLRALGPDDP